MKEENCTLDDIGAYIDNINSTYFYKNMSYEDCKKLGDFIVNVILSNEGKAMYFDGFDYEGIIIYEKLAEAFKDEWKIKPFCEAYENMLSIATHIGIENMPEMKEGQNSNIRGDFFRFFSQNQVDIIKKLLDSGKYIPQEILSEKDF